jgi:hypothetical protein
MDHVAIVADATDSLATHLVGVLRQRGLLVTYLASRSLASVQVELTPDVVRIDGERLDAVVFRAQPDDELAADFVPEDRGFCSQETRATWLAVLAHPTIVAVNPADAASWYYTSEWSLWYKRFADAGVPVGELVLGDEPSMPANGCWLTWAGTVATLPAPAARSALLAAMVSGGIVRGPLLCGSDVIHGEISPQVRAAADLLVQRGVAFAELWRNIAGEIIGATTHPVVSGLDAERVADQLGEWLYAALRRR